MDVHSKWHELFESLDSFQEKGYVDADELSEALTCIRQEARDSLDPDASEI